MMSVHDVLTAWQAGEITAGRAMGLTGAADVMELHAFSHQSGVEIRAGLLAREEEQARLATELVTRIFRDEAAEDVKLSVYSLPV